MDSDANGYKDDQIGYNFVSNDGFPQDSTGHGTFVAGVIARILNLNNGGNIKFYVLKVLDAKNKGYEYDFIRAIDWSVKQKVEIVNCSFISSFIMTDTTESPLAAAIRTAQKSNLLVSVAAGNNGKNVDLMAEWRSLPSFQLENMIVTGATVCTDSVAAFQILVCATWIFSRLVKTSFQPGSIIKWRVGKAPHLQHHKPQPLQPF